MENQLVIAPKTDLFFDIQIFEHIQRVAKVFATSTMVPVQFQNNIGNCIIALNLAARFKSDPFMVMQNMYVVHGRPGIEAKLVIALINATGRFTPLQYKYEGEKDNRSCYAYATKKADNELLEGPKVSIQMAKAEGWWSKKDKHGNETSKWQSLPELMLAYRAAVFFARLYCRKLPLVCRHGKNYKTFTMQNLHRKLPLSVALHCPNRLLFLLMKTLRKLRIRKKKRS